MREIKLTQGYTALVSDKDYSRVSKFKWHALVIKRKDGTIKNVYAWRNGVYREGNRKPHQWLHRFILNVNNPKIEVDHKDRKKD